MRIQSVKGVFMCLLALILAVSGASLSSAAPGRAAAIETVGTGTPESCTDAAWSAAIANVDPGGTVNFSCGGLATILVTTRVIEKAVIVDGDGLITLDGQTTLQPFYVLASGDLTLRKITITHGESTQGGAILNQGNITLENVTISDNAATGGDGAGIYNSGTIDVHNSLIINNTATGSGGGIFSSGGKVILSGTELNNNRATNGGGMRVDGGTAILRGSLLVGNGYATAVNGGGIYNQATITVTNTTFAGNYSQNGGGLYSTGLSIVQNSTFSVNHADIAGAIYHYSGNVLVRNTILADSLSLDSTYNSLNCDGPVLTSMGGNLGTDNSCALTQPTDQAAVADTMLSPLQDNGGHTYTLLPLTGSPAIDKGVNTNCPVKDAREIPRPQGPTCDVGALEVVQAPAFSIYLPVMRK